MRTLALIVSCALVAACDDSRSGGRGGIIHPQRDAGGAEDVHGADGTGGESDASAGEDARAGEDAGAGADASETHDAGAGGEDASLPLCRESCSTAADCASSPPTAITDDDNYACTNNLCVYTGCNTSSECQTAFNNTGYVCVQLSGDLLASCLTACSSANDCAVDAPLFGPENYRCSMGGCQWLGCLDAQECWDTYGDTSYVCEPQPGGNPSFMTCVKPCTSTDECAAPTSPAFDADNYSCTQSRCKYLGCNSTSECQASFPTGNYVCE